MALPVRIPYSQTSNAGAMLMPRLAMTLLHDGHSLEVVRLLDTGSALNVLPYRSGLALGAQWNAQTTRVPLTGALGRVEARALLLLASHPQLTPDGPVRLAFAWTQAEDVPVIFGQVNFFLAFDVCFYRSQAVFEIEPQRSVGL